MPRFPTPSRHLLLAALTAGALAAAACSPATPGITGSGSTAPTKARDVASAGGIDPAPNPDPGFPLPEGAVVEPWGTVDPRDISTSDLRGSLAPDDRTPEERVPEIIERGKLRVGIDQSQNRLSFRNPATGELEGFEVDLARELALDIFDDPDALDFRFVASSERADALARGEVDVIIRTMTITEGRQEVVQFSAPYLTVTTRMLVTRDSGIESYDDLTGKLVCAADGSTAIERVREIAPRSDILRVRRWSDCQLALQQRQVDAVITDDTILAGMADQDPTSVIVGEPQAVEMYGIGIRHPDTTVGADTADGSAGLVQQVNSTLERIRDDGTWTRLFNTWFGQALVVQSMPPAGYEAADDEAGTPQEGGAQ